MSKTWWGGLRIGWIRAEADVTNAVVRARASLDLGAAVIEQLAAAHLLAGDQAPVAERRATLAARQAALRARLSEMLPTWDANRPSGGLSLWVALPRPSAPLVTEARKCGVNIVSGERFGVGGAFRRYLRLPSCLPERELEAAVDRLAAAWDRMGDQPLKRARLDELDVY